ncbi:MAG: DUF58 domain-containing protein [Myxococcota bacterium]
MLPVPTRAATASFVGCVCAVVIGIGASSAAAVVLGTAGLAAMAFGLAVVMPVGRRLRRQRLEFAWWLEHPSGDRGGSAVPGVPFEVRCYVRHRGTQRLLASEVRPVLPVGVRSLDPSDQAIRLAPRARNEFTFRLEAPAAGRVVLQGLAITVRGPFGLYDVPLYFPNPLAVRVLPRAARRVRARAHPASGLQVERSGRTALRRRGGGTELYELRELLPGDAFNSIAWKASARFGKLMVKEVEHEVQDTRWIVLDVSGSMRGGPLGQRKLDFAIETAASEARRVLHEGDRVGVITVDGRVLGHVPPRDGVTQLPRIYDTLLAATEVVDADLTEADDREVVAIVGRYVRHQDGVDFAQGEDWDVAGLLRHVTGVLQGEPSQPTVQADEPALAPLRSYCLVRGIPLPYRPDPREGSKGPGLAAALRLTGGSPAHTMVITDFDGMTTPEPLLSTVKLLHAHGHHLTFVVPDSVGRAPAPSTPLERDLFRIYARAEARRTREASRSLRTAGVPVILANRQDQAGLALPTPPPGRRAA